MHPPRILVLVTIIGALVAGCSPAPVETPAPVPSVPTCTPEFGGTPYPCTEADYEANQRSLARYAEAERVYREFTQLSMEEHLARIETPSAELMELLDGDYKETMPASRTAALKLGTYSGARQIAWVRPTHHKAGSPGSLSLLVCTDYANWHVERTDGQPGPSGKTVTRVEMDDAKGSPRIVMISPEEGTTCD